MLSTGNPPRLAGAVNLMMLRRNSTVQSALWGAAQGVAGRINVIASAFRMIGKRKQIKREQFFDGWHLLAVSV